MIPLSPFILAGGIVLWCLSDVALALIGGNNATYSKTVLRLRAGLHGRALLRGVPYAFGVLCGHLLNPTFAPSPGFLELTVRLFLAALPVGLTFHRIVTARQGTDQDLARTFSRQSRVATAAEVVGWFAAGVVAGSVLVPQHITEQA